MNGAEAYAPKKKLAFATFIKLISFAAGSMRTDLPPSHPPLGDVGALPMAAAASTGSSEGKPNWQVPQGWKETPGGPFLVSKFMITGADNAQAAVNVSVSNGDGGGLAGNVNRWRGQLGLSPLAEADLKQLVTAVDTAGGKAMLVDMSGNDARTSQKARLIGAIVPQGNRTWFYKLMGNDQVVANEKEAFSTFVKTAKY